MVFVFATEWGDDWIAPVIRERTRNAATMFPKSSRTDFHPESHNVVRESENTSIEYRLHTNICTLEEKKDAKTYTTGHLGTN
eukprot:CAMPEP_0184029468 /NCGR_PEP_ID=MMETSP0955-20130417/505_1 /TAXON_ID=627963 /ORGANISM="Aplanochytrium sp, Strain PBS07" /LENGTH=81 /DNA_ID=CAMNT_0026314535 /DNA_START=993 /DNA_END=1238 /DNA_ORIENTATION=+